MWWACRVIQDGRVERCMVSECWEGGGEWILVRCGVRVGVVGLRWNMYEVLVKSWCGE